MERVFACAIIGARPSPVSPTSPVCSPRPLLVRPYCPVCAEGAFACDLVFAWPLPPRPPLACRPPPSTPLLPGSLLPPFRQVRGPHCRTHPFLRAHCIDL